MHRRGEVVAAIAVVMLVSTGCPPKPEVTEDPLTHHGWTAATHERAVIEKAMDLANRILQDDVAYRLAPGWESPGTSENSVPVYWLEPFRLARSELIYVPDDERIVVINARSLLTYLSKLGAEESHPQLLAAMLLHELGHIVHGHSGAWDKPEALSIDMLYDKGTQKSRELEADRFAAGQIKAAMQVGQPTERFSASVQVGGALTLASFRASTQLQLDHFGDFSGHRYQDTGYSHPNLALRLLIILHQISDDEGTRQLIETALEARQPRMPTILFKSAPLTEPAGDTPP